MIKIDTNSEKLMYNTIKLETQNGTGTGFFFNFLFENDSVRVPVIITNKHVINDNENEQVRFHLHIKNENDEPVETFDMLLNTKWFFHSKYDLCCTPIAPILTTLKEKYNKQVFYCPIDESLILSQNESEELDAQEEVTMIGYPRGLWDEYNKLPIFRKGYTAFHPGIDFNNKSLGLVDMACFPGSSGSPIFLLNEGVYSKKNRGAFIGERLKLIGILFSGPTIKTTGKIVEVQDFKTVSISENLINLGYYIKAREILEFKPIFEKLIKNTPNY